MATTEETSLLQSTNNLIREGEEDLYYLQYFCDYCYYSEVTDALETVTVDQQRLQTVLQTALSFAVRSSPIQQFGIGFGVGWYVDTVAP